MTYSNVLFHKADAITNIIFRDFPKQPQSSKIKENLSNPQLAIIKVRQYVVNFRLINGTALNLCVTE